MLSGTLTVQRPTGYTPANGESFPVVSYLARLGQFATIAGLDLGNGSQLTPLYNAANLTLQAPGGAGGDNPPALVTLFDGAGMAYTVDCRATISPRQAGGSDGGAAALTAPALANLYALTLNGQAFPCLSQERAAPESSTLVYGPALVDGITARRIVQAAADGNHVRYVELLANESTAERTVRVELASDLAFGAATRILTRPEQSGLPYAVMAGGDETAPLLAQVFGGAGEGAQLPEAAYADGDGRFGLHWPALKLAPGQTVALVYYVLHAPTADATALDAQARSLATQTAEQAAAALPAEISATVANYPAPAPEASAPRIFLPVVAGGATMAQQVEVVAPEAAPPVETPAVTPAEADLPAPVTSETEDSSALPANDTAVRTVFLPLVSTE